MKILFTLDHSVHGLYYIWYDEGFYAISRENKPCHCGYSSLSALFKAKGL